MKRGTIVAIVAAVSLTACDNPADRRIQVDDEESISVAEVFIDAFYSFDSIELEAVLSTAAASIPSIVYYQGWAEGGNYEIVKRMPCKVENAGLVSCSITVKDDLIGALGIGKIADFGFQLVGLPRVVRHYHQWLLQGAREFCRSQRCAGANQPSNRRDLA